MFTIKESKYGLTNMLLVIKISKLVISFSNGTRLVKLEANIQNFKTSSFFPMKLLKRLEMPLIDSNLCTEM